MINLYHEVSRQCSKITTEQYSTSFSSAINLLHKDLRAPIRNIYGFVRFADEIVDTFHEYDKAALLNEFKTDTCSAIARGISLNPILHSFQSVVNRYNIDHKLIDAFFYSMFLDLDKKQYDTAGYEEYIYGSAEVVGLMCLSVFCENDTGRYNMLSPFARSLGAAFQKINFLRDIQSDLNLLNRVYFPNTDLQNFTHADKLAIEADIQKDLNHAYEGISLLPLKARFGVYVAYRYYLSLFKKIKRTQPQRIFEERIRIPDLNKAFILAEASIRNRMNIL
jgi:phytoene/squalene synthetase